MQTGAVAQKFLQRHGVPCLFDWERTVQISPEVNWHGQILSLLAGSVRLTHRLNGVMLRSSVNF
jgi:hypothetical protein